MARGERVVPVSEEVGWVIVWLFLPASVFSAYLLDLTFLLYRSPEGPPLIFLLFSFCLSHTHPARPTCTFRSRSFAAHSHTHSLPHKQNDNDVAARQRNLARFKTKQKSTLSPAVCRASSVVGVVCRASQAVSLPPSFFLLLLALRFRALPCSPLWILRC